VHLDFAGNFLLAENVAESLVPRIAEFFGEQARELPAPEAVRRKLGYTDAEELYTAGDIAGMLANPPFTDQPGNAERRRSMGERARKLDAAWKSTDLGAWQTDLEAEVTRFPEDPWQRVALASVLDARGDTSAALVQKREIAALIPFDVTALLNLGRAEAGAGNMTQAKEAFRRAAQLDPLFAKTVIELAACAMRENNPREAETLLENFLRRDPESIEVHLALAQIARYEKRLRDARTHLQTILKFAPDNTEALTELRALTTPRNPSAPE
jgi:Flp pilus assembly protein TadD